MQEDLPASLLREIVNNLIVLVEQMKLVPIIVVNDRISTVEDREVFRPASYYCCLELVFYWRLRQGVL